MAIIRITIVGCAAFRIGVDDVVPFVIFVDVTPLEGFIVIVSVADLCSNLRFRVRFILVIGTIYITWKGSLNEAI